MNDSNDEKKEYQVLEFFGIPIKVKSKNVAEVLTMDAKEALRADIKDLKGKLKKNGHQKSSQAEEEEVEEIEKKEVPKKEKDYSQEWLKLADNAQFSEVIEFIGQNIGFVPDENRIWTSKNLEKLAVFPISKQFEIETLRKAFNSFQKYIQKMNILSGIIVTAKEEIGQRVEKALYVNGKCWPIRCLTYEDLIKIKKLKETGKISNKIIMLLFSPHHTNNVRTLLDLTIDYQKFL